MPTPYPNSSPTSATSRPSARAIPDGQCIGDREKLGVVRFNWRTGSAQDLALFKVDLRRLSGRGVPARARLRMGRDRLVPPALQDRMIAEADELTPHNRFHVRDYPPAPHMGPLNPGELADALHAVRLARPGPASYGERTRR